VSFDRFDLVGCDGFRPDEEFANWDMDGEVKSTLCLRGQPPVFDTKTNEHLEFKWPRYLNDESKCRVLSKTGFATIKDLSNSLRSFYRRERSVIFFNETKWVWTVYVPVPFHES
jgi:hypothetical protein